MSQSYWQDAAADEAMQDDHAFVWSAMVETVDVDLAGTRVLDAGCNRGGFLRQALSAGPVQKLLLRFGRPAR